MERVEIGGIQVAAELHRFVTEEALPGTGIRADEFWTRLGALFADLAPRNRELLQIRDRMQERIDEWLRERKGEQFDQAEYEHFLRDIGYLLPEPETFTIGTANVDAEIAASPGRSSWCR